MAVSAFVDPMTPLRCAAEEAERARDATERRNDWIRAARDDGRSLREIATFTGLSHTAIAKIVATGNTNSRKA